MISLVHRILVRRVVNKCVCVCVFVQVVRVRRFFIDRRLMGYPALWRLTRVPCLPSPFPVRLAVGLSTQALP